MKLSHFTLYHICTFYLLLKPQSSGQKNPPQQNNLIIFQMTAFQILDPIKLLCVFSLQSLSSIGFSTTISYKF